MAAKNIGHARAATLMAGYLKFLPLFLIIMPGMISRVLFPGKSLLVHHKVLKFIALILRKQLYIKDDIRRKICFPDTVGCADPDTCMKVCENPSGCSNIAYPSLILGLAPVGWCLCSFTHITYIRLY